MRLTQILGCTPSISLELICMQRAFIMPQCDYPFLTQSQLWRLRCEFFTIIMGHLTLILMHFWQKHFVVVLNHICTVMAINIQPLSEFDALVPQLDKPSMCCAIA